MRIALQTEGQFHAIGFQQRLVPQDGFRVPVCHNVSVGQEDHPLAGVQDHIQVVGSDELGLGQLTDGVDDGAAVDGIQGGGWLIHQDHLRLHGENCGDGGHPLFAAGDFVVIAVFQFRESQTVQYVIHPALRFLLAQAVVPGAEDHVLIDGRHKHLIVGILQYKSDFLPDRGNILLVQGKIIYGDLSLSADQAQEQLHNGGFPGAVGANQTYGFTLLNGETQILHHRIALS